MAQARTIKVGGASGYWGESDMALPQLLKAGGLDYIVFDYLAEITMSIMARARAKDASLGYATDFVTAALKPNLKEIARQGVKIVSNAGGVNPEACATAARALIEEQGLDLTVAVVTGDDLAARVKDFAAAGVTEMFTGAPFPDPAKVASVNAYLGAFPVAAAFGAGADIVITGRCVDSAVTLGACIHAFGWGADDLDKLAGGSLAGHILECGPQATGGNYTDWEAVAERIDEIGYPIAEISEDGSFVVSKPEGTGGAVTVGTVGEQLLYEIGDPQAYLLPDVVCDFSKVTLEQTGADQVRVAGAKGRAAPDSYKVSATYMDGWRAGAVFFFAGEKAAAKARVFAGAGVERARGKLRALNAPDYEETLIEVVGDESSYGATARDVAPREVAVKVAVKHVDDRAAGLVLKELTGMGLATPPGLTMFAGGRPKPSPVVRLFSFLVSKSEVEAVVSAGARGEAAAVSSGVAFDVRAIERPAPPELPDTDETLVEVPLSRLAWARSGDKGDNANIGVLPREKAYAPWIWAALTEDEVARRFAHILKGPVERFFLPGTGAINFLLHDVLGGGGVASLRNDPQGKSYAQILLAAEIPVPRSIAEAL
ncbi:MAG: DUF1446 domain-containing protein [Maricaulaceae bacterium]